MVDSKRGLFRKYKTGDEIAGRKLIKAYVDKIPSGQYRHLVRCDCGKEFLCTSGNIRKGNGCGCRKWKAELGNPIQKISNGEVFGTMEVQIAYVMKGRNFGRFHAVTCLECGARKVLRTDKLKMRKDRGCVCDGTSERKHKIKVGETYGSWEVLATYTGKNGRAYKHTCRCKCGVVKKIEGSALSCQNSSQCVSCAGKSRRTATPQMHVLRRYKSSAKGRGIDFRLSLEEFSSIIAKNCKYCGGPPKQRKTSGPEPFRFNGIDRVDSSIGYLADNCVPCCPTCNFMKLDMTKEDFLNKVREIYTQNEDFYSPVVA